jgi:hypothetical protein
MSHLYIFPTMHHIPIVGPWLWKEAKNKEEKGKSELRGRHNNYHWVEVRKRAEKMSEVQKCKLLDEEIEDEKSTRKRD